MTLSQHSSPSDVVVVWVRRLIRSRSLSYLGHWRNNATDGTVYVGRYIHCGVLRHLFVSTQRSGKARRTSEAALRKEIWAPGPHSGWVHVAYWDLLVTMVSDELHQNQWSPVATGKQSPYYCRVFTWSRNYRAVERD